MNIEDIMFENALASPLAIAFTILEDDEAKKEITYRQLAVRVKELALHLNEQALGGKRALLVYQDTLEFIVSFLACQYAGVIPVPILYNKGNKQIERLFAIIEDAQATAVCCTHHSVPHLQKEFAGSEHMQDVGLIATDIRYTEKNNLPPSPQVKNEISFIQYTSGSTGKPKGVVITRKNLMHNQQLIKDAFGCDKESVIFSWLPFHHDMGLIGNILHALYIGCTCMLMPALHFMQAPSKWLKAISKYKVTHSGGPNFAYDLCVDKILPHELAALDLSSWKVAYNGSEPIRQKTLQRFADCFGPSGFKTEAFYPCYGLAEATLLVAGSKKENLPITILINKERSADNSIKLAEEADDRCQAIVSSGVVAPGMELKIISPEHQNECAALQEGEICISGDSVTKGYWNKDSRSAFYELENKMFFRTGDLGFLHNGTIFVQGRLTEMLIVRGRNIYPYDIEQMVSGSDTAIEMNGVSAFCAGPSGNDLIIAAEIKRTFIKDLDAAAVIQTIDRKIAGAFGVDAFDIILTTPLGIPRTTSGKLQRVKCREYYREGTFRQIASKSGLFKKIADKKRNNLLSQEVLRNVNYVTISNYLIDVIGSKTGSLHKNELNGMTELTEIGINSLKAIELINIINNDLSLNIDAAKIFQENSIAGLINTIENMLWLKNEQTSGEEITI